MRSLRDKGLVIIFQDTFLWSATIFSETYFPDKVYHTIYIQMYGWNIQELDLKVLCKV